MYYSTTQNRVYSCSEKVLLLINTLGGSGVVVILLFAEFAHCPMTFASYRRKAKFPAIKM